MSQIRYYMLLGIEDKVTRKIHIICLQFPYQLGGDSILRIYALQGVARAHKERFCLQRLRQDMAWYDTMSCDISHATVLTDESKENALLVKMFQRLWLDYSMSYDLKSFDLVQNITKGPNNQRKPTFW